MQLLNSECGFADDAHAMVVVLDLKSAMFQFNITGIPLYEAIFELEL